MYLCQWAFVLQRKYQAEKESAASHKRPNLFVRTGNTSEQSMKEKYEGEAEIRKIARNLVCG